MKKLIVAVVFLLLIGVPLGWFMTVRHYVAKMENGVEKTVFWVNTVQLVDVAESERAQIVEHLATLRQEMRGDQKLTYKANLSSLDLLLRLMIRDEKLDRKEFQQWEDYFAKRSTLPDQFSSRVIRLHKLQRLESLQKDTLLP